METLRTPDERFENLPDFPFEPNYAEIPDGDGGTLRVHYLDEGPADAAPVLLLHGEPSWGFLYRHMIPPLVGAGHRVIVPDQVGFGRSDKPAAQSDYTYARHVAWMSSLVFDHLDLRDTTFFGQDWGGLIGLRLVAAQPDRFAGVVISNTGLPNGHTRPSEAFLAWQQYSQTADEFPIGAIISRAVVTPMAPEVIAAYDAPYPDDSYTAGARIWPSLVPTSLDDPEAPANQEAWAVLESFDKPFLCCFSDQDPVTAGGDKPFRERIPGAAGQAHTTVENGGHFVQEDRGPELARIVNDLIDATS
ncbi:MAG: haloalkane dehalogenase [Actinomycetota bacterium]